MTAIPPLTARVEPKLKPWSRLGMPILVTVVQPLVSREKRYTRPWKSLAPGAPTHSSAPTSANALPKRAPNEPSNGSTRATGDHRPPELSRAYTQTAPAARSPGAPMKAVSPRTSSAAPKPEPRALSLPGAGTRASSFKGAVAESRPYTYTAPDPRSEERRVGKECRSRWSPY